MTTKDIVDAWAKIRTIDQSIPDEVLDFMKDAAIEKLKQELPSLSVFKSKNASGKTIYECSETGKFTEGITALNQMLLYARGKGYGEVVVVATTPKTKDKSYKLV